MTEKKLIILAGISAILFVVMSLLVHFQQVGGFDLWATKEVQNTIGVEWAVPMSLLSLLGSVEITGLILLGILFAKLRFNLMPIAVVLFLFAAPIGIEIVGKNVLVHPGPPDEFHRFSLPFYFPSRYVQTKYAFPSGHMLRTTFLAVLAAFLIQQSKLKSKSLYLGACFLVLATMALSRVYLGEHWASDVIGGILLGTAFSAMSGMYLDAQSKKE